MGSVRGWRSGEGERCGVCAAGRRRRRCPGLGWIMGKQRGRGRGGPGGAAARLLEGDAGVLLRVVAELGNRLQLGRGGESERGGRVSRAGFGGGAAWLLRKGSRALPPRLQELPSPDELGDDVHLPALLEVLLRRRGAARGFAAPSALWRGFSPERGGRGAGRAAGGAGDRKLWRRSGRTLRKRTLGWCIWARSEISL